MSRFKPVLTVIALLTLLALAAPRVDTAASPTAQAHAHVQVSVPNASAAVALDAAFEEAVTVMHTACTEVAAVLDSWPTLVARAIALFDEWVKSFGLPDLHDAEMTLADKR